MKITKVNKEKTYFKILLLLKVSIYCEFIVNGVNENMKEKLASLNVIFYCFRTNEDVYTLRSIEDILTFTSGENAESIIMC